MSRSGGASVRVMVLADQRIVGEGIAGSLSQFDDLASLGVATSLDELDGRLRRLNGAGPLDVIVADIDVDGALHLPRRLGSAGPSVVFLARAGRATFTRQAIDSGGAGLVRTSEPVETLAKAVRRVAGGHTAFRVADLRLARDAAPPPTQRQLQVLRCLAEGLSNRQAGERLGIAERTVEQHVARLLALHGCGNRVELAVRAVHEGWVATDPDRAGAPSGGGGRR